jgi:hypothetical protein
MRHPLTDWPHPGGSTLRRPSLHVRKHPAVRPALSPPSTIDSRPPFAESPEIKEAAMQTAEHEIVGADTVCEWRREELERAGYPAAAALMLALSPEVDLHCAVDLLRAGCPAETAVRILL